MFTGIIRHQGTIVTTSPEAGAVLLQIDLPGIPDLHIGDSIAVNGVCLTPLTVMGTVWQVRLMQETLQKTNLGKLAPGDRVNLERPLRAGETLDGHFVLGHIDGCCVVDDMVTSKGDTIFTLTTPAHLMRYLIAKGSVALDGVSLTVIDVSPTAFTVSVMPYTMQETTLGNAKRGYLVNLEVDVLGKYVERLLPNVLPS